MFKHQHQGNRKFFSWIKGALFGSIVATITTLIMSPKISKKIRTKFRGWKHSSKKQTRALAKNSRRHTKIFVGQAKNFANNIRNDLHEFTSSLKQESYK